jgi:hypothetical protein
MRFTTMKIGALALAAMMAVVGAAVAQAVGPGGQGAGLGPVASACQTAIEQKCVGKEHGNRDIRACLEANRASLSAACKAALDNTGGGRGYNRNN